MQIRSQVRGSVLFNSCRTDHGRGRLPYAGLAEAFGVYDAESAAVYLVPVVGAPDFVVTLRLEPARNNQAVGVRQARDYEISRWSRAELRNLVAAADSSEREQAAPLPGV